MLNFERIGDVIPQGLLHGSGDHRPDAVQRRAQADIAPIAAQAPAPGSDVFASDFGDQPASKIVSSTPPPTAARKFWSACRSPVTTPMKSGWRAASRSLSNRCLLAELKRHFDGEAPAVRIARDPGLAANRQRGLSTSWPRAGR